MGFPGPSDFCGFYEPKPSFISSEVATAHLRDSCKKSWYVISLVLTGNPASTFTPQMMPTPKLPGYERCPLDTVRIENPTSMKKDTQATHVFYITSWKARCRLPQQSVNVAEQMTADQLPDKWGTPGSPHSPASALETSLFQKGKKRKAPTEQDSKMHACFLNAFVWIVVRAFCYGFRPVLVFCERI